MRDAKDATVEAVAGLIGKAADSLGEARPSPAMITAYEAIISMIEKRSSSPSTIDAMNKVRAAVGIPIPAEAPNAAPKQESNA